jgi:hypothetical protein
MLTQIGHWTEYAAAGIDLALLLRVLGLRLQRTYVFLTLACVLTVLFDAADLSLARDSAERQRVEVYASLLSAFVFPLAAWDVFEELGTVLAALRRIAILRTATSLLMVTFFGVILAASHGDDPSGLAFIFTLTLFASTGSATACLMFLWSVHRAMRQQKVAAANNTFVWMVFLRLFLFEQAAQWLILLVEETLGRRTSPAFEEVTQIVLMSYVMAISIWCAVKLKALPKDLPSASLNENS